jgi:hypothetical protein
MPPRAGCESLCSRIRSVPAKAANRGVGPVARLIVPGLRALNRRTRPPWSCAELAGGSVTSLRSATRGARERSAVDGRSGRAVCYCRSSSRAARARDGLPLERDEDIMTRRSWTGLCALWFAANAIACGGSDSSGGGTGTGGSSGAAGASASGGMGGASGSGSGGLGGVSGSGGSSGAGGSGAAGASGIPSDLGTPCKNDACSPGLTPVSYCGLAGCSQGSFCSCEIPCDKDPKVCPAGTSCTTISDGPGTVCVK